MDLIYADPPFFSNKHYEIIWQDGYEIRAFEDRWKGGIENYIAWMQPKLSECYRVLKPTGSLYLHCDWHANAHLRLLTDKIFGESNFRNEIVWRRTHAHGGGETGFSRVHDTILFYSKTDNFIFNRQHVPYSESYIENFFRFKEPDGRRYRLVIATGSGETKTDYMWKGVGPTKGRHWAYTEAKMRELEKEGLLVYSKNGMPSVKQYIDEKEGTLVPDIWSDVGVIHSQSKERLGYPTQKPEALLERIINASSNPKDLVLDPFCGCGTAIAAAQKMKDKEGRPVPRRWIGIDVSPVACKLMAKRMTGLGILVSDMDIIGLPQTLGDVKAMQPFQFQNWVLQKLGGRVSERKVADGGIDGWLWDRPVQVKQSDGVGVNVLRNFETAIRAVKKTEGIVVGFSFGKGAYEEAARAKLEEGLAITLMTVEDVLNAV